MIGAEAGHEIIGDLLEIYEAPEFRMSLDTPNNDLFTRYFIDRVRGFRLDGRAWSSDQIAVLPKHAFEHPRFLNDDGYSIHHFDASWRPRSPGKALALKTVKRVMGLRGYRKYVCAKALRISPFSGEYVGRS